MQIQKLKNAIATHNKVLHSDSALDCNGGSSDLPEFSGSPKDYPL